MRTPDIRSTGLAAWWVQRLSAAYMLVFVIFLLTTFGSIQCRATRSGLAGSAAPILGWR